MGGSLKSIIERKFEFIKGKIILKLSENSRSSKCGARNVNTGDEAGAIGLSTELLASAERDASPLTLSMGAAARNSSCRATSSVWHSSSKFSSCTMAAVVSASVHPPSQSAAAIALIWLHCKTPAPLNYPASPAAGRPPPPESD